MIEHALAVRSDFSIGESILQVDKIIAKAKELGYKSVCLVDTMSVSAMVNFTSKAKKAGIKPVIGCTLRVFDDPKYRPPKAGDTHEKKDNPSCRIKVYVQNEDGLRSLLRILSIGNREENFYYTSRIGWDDLEDTTGLTFSTGDMWNVFHLQNHHERLARLVASGKTVYAELVPINTPLFDRLNKSAVNASATLGLPLLATYPIFYGDDSDADTLDVLRAISSNSKMDSRALSIPYTRDFSFKAPAEIGKRLLDMKKRLEAEGVTVGLGAALANAGKLVESCTFQFEKMQPSLPKMAEDEFVSLLAEVRSGWESRFGSKVLGHKPEPAEMDKYKDRLKHELGVLRKMNFSGYFLLVQDIVQWAKREGIIVGPGRGSVGGSLVAYLLGITDVDPIRFDLLFERFINPDRLDLPDADLDFMSSRRHEVIEYIARRYGKECVAGISNFNALQGASAMRDTSRVHNMDVLDYNCSKLVPKEHGIPVSLDVAAEQVPEIERFKLSFPDIWRHASKLEGVMKSLGQHAAGIVVAGEPLINRAVVEKRAETHVVNWDKGAVEDLGLIKMDILGLSTLDVLELGRKYVEERHKIKLNYLKTPLDEPMVLSAFGKGDTIGIFQFESSGMRKLLQQLGDAGALTFDDLVAVVALYRPGPLDAGLCDEYIKRKQGVVTVHYEHPLMEPALKPTFGVIVYQEQVMQVARDLAGFTLTEADHLRKAMGKKDVEKMKEWREKFVSGATGNGMEETAANALWEKIEVFAGYAFNKSHSVEYSIISYWTMWLKSRYPAEFYAASMTVVSDDDKLASLVLDARKKDISVLSPDINKSSTRIEIDGERVLYAPFQAVKGISENVAGQIMEARKKIGRAFTSQEEFEATVNKTKCNKSHREKLERVGAFASITSGALPANHPDRLKDRIELMPGFTVDAVKVDRGINDEKIAQIKILEIMNSCRTCDKCSLAGGTHPSPRMGKTPKFMMVFDTPNFKEDRKGVIFEGDTAEYVKSALKDVGLSANDGYFTTLVKAPKKKDQKMLTNEQINGCSGFLEQEIEILNPGLIVPMGAAAARYFAPGVKASPSELIGKVIYRPDLKASIVFGLNPAQVLFDGSKAKLLQSVCEKIKELIS